MQSHSTIPSVSVVDRFLTKIRLDDACHIWMGTKTKNGYGKFHYEGKLQLAHRLAYTWANGPIPPGLTIDHRCLNRACVNSAHMELVTGKTNTLRGNGPTAQNATKTHCKYGHPFDEANTYRWAGAPDYRGCRQCRLRTTKAHLARKLQGTPVS